MTEEAGSTDLLNWKIDSPKPAVFVDNETLAPGWKAYVDGRRAPLSLANGIFRGVVAPAGKHRVGLVLDSQTLRFSLFLALVGISVAVAVGSGKRPDRQKAS